MAWREVSQFDPERNTAQVSVGLDADVLRERSTYVAIFDVLAVRIGRVSKPKPKGQQGRRPGRHRTTKTYVALT